MLENQDFVVLDFATRSIVSRILLHGNLVWHDSACLDILKSPSNCRSHFVFRSREDLWFCAILLDCHART
jgi:hypothetical protein